MRPSRRTPSNASRAAFVHGLPLHASPPMGDRPGAGQPRTAPVTARAAETQLRRLVVLARGPIDQAVADALRRSRWQIEQVSDASALAALARSGDCGVGLAVFPDDADETLLGGYADAIRAFPEMKWIAVLSEAQIARQAIKALIVERLYDFQKHPLDPARLSFALGHAFGMAQITQALCGRQPPGKGGRFGLIGTSRAMQGLYKATERAAACDVPVLLLGPTGTGKERIARAIHGHSSRADGPFVAVNCAAIPPSLLPAELFGYEKGAFTHAFERKRGYLAEASGGTLLLDEIGELPLESQASLLRFLDNHLVTPLGAIQGTEVDVRVLAATNRDLERLVAAGAFRADLYYRLAVLTVRTPPLSERRSDIPALAEHFLQEVSRVTSTAATGFAADAIKALRAHGWPGNLRELRSRVVQAAIQTEATSISRMDLGLAGPGPEDAVKSIRAARDEAERSALAVAIQKTDGNVAGMMELLEVSRMTLYRLLAKHGMDRRWREQAQPGRVS